MFNYWYLHNTLLNINSTIFKQQLTNISTVLNNTDNTTKLLTSFNALDLAQQKVLLSSKLLTEEQKAQCLTMATLSSVNAKYTAEQITKATNVSAETLANWGLKESTDALTLSQLAEIASSDAQAKNVLDKIIAQNAQAVANGKVVTSNIALASSESGVALATGTFTTAIKANISAMKTWLLTTPVGLITTTIGAIFLAVKAYDALTVSVEEQKEKMEESLSAYEDAKSELSSITTELETQEQAIDKLLDKEKLTYAEKGQLEELQAITRELRIQKDLAEKEEDRTEKQLAKDASDLFNKQFGSYNISESAVERYMLDNRAGLLVTADTNNISAMIAGYKQFNELLDEAYGEGNQEDIDHFESLTEDLKDSIFTTAQELQKQQDNISGYYKSIKDTPYKDLTTEQQEIVDSYNAISNAIQLIYQQLDPNTWNSMQVDSIFSTEGIEKNKDELVEMAKSGELTPDIIRGYTNLNKALGETTLSAQDLCDELYAIADAQGEVQDNPTPDISSLFSDPEDIKHLETYQKGIKSISTALFDLNNLNASDITSLMSDFSEHGEVFKRFGVDGREGVGNLRGALEEIARQMKNTAAKEVPQLTEAIEEMFGVIENPKGSIDKISSEIEELETVLSNVRNGENVKNIESLINKYGDLADSVIITADGYSIEEDAIVSLLNTRVEYYNSALAYDAEYTKECISNIEKRAEAMFKVEAGALRAIADVRRTNSEYTTRVYAKQKYGIDDTRFNLALQQGIALNDWYKQYEELLASIKEPFEKDDKKDDKNSSIDWMTTSLENLQEAVDDANRTFDNAKGIEAQKEALSALNGELEKLRKGYRFASDEYNTRYKNALYSLNEYDYDKDDIQRKIEAGHIFDTDSFPSDVAELINDAIDAWNGKRYADNKVVELGIDIQDNTDKIPDLIMEEFDRQLAYFESQANMIESSLANAESKGLMATQEYYKALKDVELDKVSIKENELKSLQTVFDSGEIEKGSDAWYDLREDIESVKLEILEAENAIDDFDNKIRQVDWDMFDFAREQESKLMGEADFMIDLLDSAKLFSDAGEMTAEGLAVMGLHAQNYNAYLEQSIAYAEELAKRQSEIEAGSTDKAVIDRYNELLELRQESILSAEAEKDAMIDLVSEGIELQKESFSELISQYTEALDIQKD